jgi:hypothetical protein
MMVHAAPLLSARQQLKHRLCLNAEADGPAKCPADAVKASDVAWECIPVMPPAGFTRENADVIVATMIQCATRPHCLAVWVPTLCASAQASNPPQPAVWERVTVGARVNTHGQ